MSQEAEPSKSKSLPRHQPTRPVLQSLTSTAKVSIVTLPLTSLVSKAYALRQKGGREGYDAVPENPESK